METAVWRSRASGRASGRPRCRRTRSGSMWSRSARAGLVLAQQHRLACPSPRPRNARRSRSSRRRRPRPRTRSSAGDTRRRRRARRTPRPRPRTGEWSWVSRRSGAGSASRSGTSRRLFGCAHRPVDHVAGIVGPAVLDQRGELVLADGRSRRPSGESTRPAQARSRGRRCARRSGGNRQQQRCRGDADDAEHAAGKIEARTPTTRRRRRPRRRRAAGPSNS